MLEVPCGLGSGGMEGAGTDLFGLQSGHCYHDNVQKKKAVSSVDWFSSGHVTGASQHALGPSVRGLKCLVLFRPLTVPC